MHTRKILLIRKATIRELIRMNNWLKRGSGKAMNSSYPQQEQRPWPLESFIPAVVIVTMLSDLLIFTLISLSFFL